MSADALTATRTREPDGSCYVSQVGVRLRSPDLDATGVRRLTFQLLKGNAHFGWCQLGSDLGMDLAQGSWVHAANGDLAGLGNHEKSVPQSASAGSWMKANDTVTLLYRPQAGTIHGFRNCESAQLWFSGVASDLVPMVCFWSKDDSVVIEAPHVGSHVMTVTAAAATSLPVH